LVAARAAAVRVVAPQEVTKLLQAQLPYLDVRTEQEFAAGHVKGAINGEGGPQITDQIG